MNQIKIKRALYFGVVVVGLYLIGLFIGKILDFTFFQHNQKLVASFSSAFFGALFGLVTFNLNGWIKGYFERKTKAYNGLVHSELYLNRINSQTYDNIYLLKGLITFFEKIKELNPKQIIFPYGFIDYVEFPAESKEIFSTDLINRFFLLSMRLPKMNVEFDGILEMKKEIQNIVALKDPPKEKLPSLIDPLIIRSNMLIKELEMLSRDINDALEAISKIHV